MVFGIGLFKYSITNVNTECVIKYLKILSIHSGHKKKGKKSWHAFEYGYALG